MGETFTANWTTSSTEKEKKNNVTLQLSGNIGRAVPANDTRKLNQATFLEPLMMVNDAISRSPLKLTTASSELKITGTLLPILSPMII